MIFISYTHDSSEHRDKVLALAERLREDGLDAQLDQYVKGMPEQGWPRWMLDQIDAAEFVLVICTPTYYRRFRGLEEPGRGRGGAVITQEIYDAKSRALKFVPVTLEPGLDDTIPEPLRPLMRYEVTSESGYGELYAFLRGQAGVEPRPLGDLRPITKRYVEPLKLGAQAGQRVASTRLPRTADRLFGRESELATLDAAWADPAVHVVTLVASGGAGKTSLVAKWVSGLAAREYDGANYFGWSFYSQGTREQRVASADFFVAAALRFFGDEAAAGSRSPWDRGTRLAQLVAERRTLLVLDGLEPLQHPSGPLAGQLKEPAVIALLKGLAQRNAGLCVVTTRQPVKDLEAFEKSTAPTLVLKRLSKQAGVEFLRSLGIHGSEAAIEGLVEAVDGNPLALNLLGSLLRDAYGGDAQRGDRLLPYALDDDREHAIRVIEEYEKWLSGGENGKRLLAVLQLLGLLDRPATAELLGVLRRDPPIIGLTDAIQNDEHWNRAVVRLTQIGLVTQVGDLIDAHPLIRQHFGRRLREGNPTAWKSALERLQEVSTSERPVDDSPVEPAHVGRFLPLGSKVTAADHLNRGGLVDALAAMLEDPQQETPLTIALLGDWGAGKSTLMALLRERLLKRRLRRFCFAEFNAWEYELTDNMAAGLAQEVVAGLVHDARLELPRARRTATPPGGKPIPPRRLHLSRWLSPGFWWLFGGYLLRRHGMRLLGIALLVAGLGWAVREGLLAPELIAPRDENLQEALGLAGALGGLVLLFYLLRGVKHVLEHPFAIGIKTYLRLPRYEQHLGLVPVIKREVETLAGIWLGRTWTQQLAVRWLAKDGRRERWPRLERWSRPRRLVVFVDDLDRCSHARIGQTLDAIRLVMDVPQVVVVLGIDPRIAFQAMALQYKEIADARRSPEEIAREYLGKIIQVPIRLRRPSSDELEEFVAQRLFAGAAESHPGRAATVPIGSTVAGTGAPETVPSDARESGLPTDGDAPPIGTVEVAELVDPPPLPAAPPPPPEGPDLLAEVMRPDEGERIRFQELVDAYRFHNPRQLIRLFNSYNLLKLFAATRRGTGGQVPPREELMRLLFDEEFLHETPAPAQADLERALKGDRLAARRLAPELAERVEAVRKLDLPSSDPGTSSADASRSSRLADQATRDFVRLVVLPASPADPPPKAKRSSAKSRRPAKKGKKASPPSAGSRAGRKQKAAESITDEEAPVLPISPKPS